MSEKIAREIDEADADHVLALKGNHETVHEKIKAFLGNEMNCYAKPASPRMACNPVPPTTFAILETSDKGHGRLESRLYYQSRDLDWSADFNQ